jgi:two-component system cell cycle response regulator
MDEKEIRVLLVEDNEDDIFIVKKMLDGKKTITGERFKVTGVDNFRAATSILHEHVHDIVLVDLHLPDSFGLQTVTGFQQWIDSLPLICLTGSDDDELALTAIKTGFQDFLNKDSIGTDILTNAIQYAIERHNLLKQIQKLTLHDDLTGAYNRRGFFHLLEQQVKQARRHKIGFFLMYIDINDFKSINDTLGHAAGDQALIDISEILGKTFRDSDVVARIGGDEFAIFPWEAGFNTAEIIKKRLIDTINKFNEENNREYTLSISIGTSIFNPEDDVSIDDLIACADNAMYLNKKAMKENDK